MNLKAQTEILDDRTIHYTTIYIEIDQESMTEIKEPRLTKTQPFLFTLWEGNCKMGGGKILDKITTWLKKLPPKENNDREKDEKLKRRKQKMHIEKNLHIHTTNTNRRTSTIQTIIAHKQPLKKNKLIPLTVTKHNCPTPLKTLSTQ